MQPHSADATIALSSSPLSAIAGIAIGEAAGDGAGKERWVFLSPFSEADKTEAGRTLARR